MARRKTIAVVTGTRAEFGLLQTVMHAVREHPGLTLKTIVAGLHLCQKTWRDVENAGFKIDYRVPMQRLGKTGRVADVQSLSRGTAGFGRAFEALQPDIVLLLGDRIEAFAAASAASIGGFRLAHIHGGDRAEGVADEAMRHAISKLAHLHYAATATSKRRLIRMGEHVDQVIHVGSPSIDAIASIGTPADDVGFIVMLHPTGDTDRHEAARMRHVLAAVTQAERDLPVAPTRTHYLFAPNADPGSDGIRQAIETFASRRVSPSTPSFHLVDHLPREAFLRLLAGSLAIVGNSSAGLIEAAALKTPCVNIGDRQAGREKPANVIDCDANEAAIIPALRAAGKLDLRRMRHPYGNGRAGQAIANHLASLRLANLTLRKRNAY